MLPLVLRGAVTDRPWGATLAGLVANGASGELVLIADGKRYTMAFNTGGVVGAYAPGAADSVGRIALTGHMVSSTQVAEITRRIAAQPERDEIEVIAEVARLSVAQADTLRRRVIIQRAARTFAIETGTFAFDDKVPTRELAGGAIEGRAVIYQGARLHLPETRIANELRAMGQRFVLTLEAASELPRFGFGDLEKPVLEALRAGTTVAELEARRRELDPRMISAVIYTLATCGACGRGAFATGGQASLPRPIDDAPSAKVLAPMRLVNQRASTKDGTPAPSGDPPTGPVRVLTKEGVPAPTPRVPTKDGPPPILVTPPVGNPLAIPRTMTPQPVLSRTATPIPPLAAGSNPALKSVTIPPIAVHLTMTPQPASEPPLQVRTSTKDRMSPDKLDALDAFQRGEMALRREQIDQAIADFARALELQPDNADYAAMLAWAKFCAAGDKHAVAAETRRQIDRAITRTTDSVIARMCLGRVERMLGRDREALRHFQQVLEKQPRHSGAASEARVLEARLRR